MRYAVTEFLGDGISNELAQALRTLTARLPFEIEFQTVDLSLANRTRRGLAIYDEAVESIRRTRFAIKYPTATVTESPNAILRNRCDFSVIYRPVASIPGVPSNFKHELDLHIVRIATGGTYDDPGRAIGKDAAVSLRIVERQPCWEAAHYAFTLARRMRCSMTSASKYTIQAATDGLFEHVVDNVAGQYPDIKLQHELFDALLAKIIMFPDRFDVVLVLNEYGDFLSDMACGLAGSIGIGASASFSFNSDGKVALGMFDPVGGTAPDIAGKNLANPTAIFLAFAMLLAELGELAASRAVQASVFELLRRGETTKDLGGQLSTTEFSQRVADQLAHVLSQETAGLANNR